MTLNQYDHEVRKECVNLGLLGWQPTQKQIALYRNAGYTPKEVAEMEQEEYRQHQYGEPASDVAGE